MIEDFPAFSYTPDWDSLSYGAKIWVISTSNLESIVQSSKTFADVFESMGIKHKTCPGLRFKVLKERMLVDKIDFSGLREISVAALVYAITAEELSKLAQESVSYAGILKSLGGLAPFHTQNLKCLRERLDQEGICYDHIKFSTPKERASLRNKRPVELTKEKLRVVFVEGSYKAICTKYKVSISTAYKWIKEDGLIGARLSGKITAFYQKGHGEYMDKLNSELTPERAEKIYPVSPERIKLFLDYLKIY